MNSPDTIDRLKRKRQKNVQEQNELLEHQLLRTARWFRENQDSVPEPIVQFLKSKGVDLSSAIAADYEDLSALGLPGLFTGLIVNLEHEFWYFEVQLDDGLTKVESIEKWEDVSKQYPVNAHTPGIGKSEGHLCIEVLSQLNNGT